MNPWPFLFCVSCGHGQTFAGHLVTEGKAVGWCDMHGGERDFSSIKPSFSPDYAHKDLFRGFWIRADGRTK
jgi:hypothetical protein